jgi:hypothetical protein
MNIDKYIYVKTTAEYFHKYENAKESVKFLRDLHRHLLYFKVYIQVFGNDREVEFFEFKKYIETIIKEDIQNNSNYSCETISNMLSDRIKLDYPGRTIMIDISEDNENGSFIVYNIEDK